MRTMMIYLQWFLIKLSMYIFRIAICSTLIFQSPTRRFSIPLSNIAQRFVVRRSIHNFVQYSFLFSNFVLRNFQFSINSDIPIHCCVCIMIIIYFENVNFFHAKLGLDVCPIWSSSTISLWFWINLRVAMCIQNLFWMPFQWLCDIVCIYVII